ncbi:hypothetical protein SETIT_1G250000v2 [Setaria italica]|uniref:Uncharacterized protein n=1 Tax=Setaria italica TaxID=4555 RepID=A0A368PPF6_SETIT|nr:hypothetical protein SETIT_1G250000v2 [Setaria italica]
MSNEGVINVLSDIDNLLEEKLDEDGNLAARGWLPPPVASAYAASKALVNAYSRLLARRQPSLVVCCVNPGFVRTGMSYGMGLVSAEAGAKPPVVLALRDEPGDSGLNFELFDVCDLRVPRRIPFALLCCLESESARAWPRVGYHGEPADHDDAAPGAGRAATATSARAGGTGTARQGPRGPRLPRGLGL